MSSAAQPTSLHDGFIAEDATPKLLTDATATATTLTPSDTVVFANVPGTSGGQDITLPPASKCGNKRFLIYCNKAGSGDDVTVMATTQDSWIMPAQVLTTLGGYVVIDCVAGLGFIAVAFDAAPA